MLAHQIAYIERDLTVVFDSAFAFRMAKQIGWTPCGDSLPPRPGFGP